LENKSALPIFKPSWLRVKAPGGTQYQHTKSLIDRLALHTVCREAHCPNVGECWAAKTATFMILGDNCTRYCNFCAVKKAPQELAPPLTDEPQRVAEAVKTLELKHAVITSVTRDDLADFGAGHFAAVVREVKKLSPECRVELLIPDLQGSRKDLETIVKSGVDVLGHNLETVPRLYAHVRKGADYHRSLWVLAQAKEIRSQLVTKSGVMVGLGETYQEILNLMDDLRTNGVDILTIGQYLRPSPAQVPVVRYVPPEEFQEYAFIGRSKGFNFVEAGPLVRSSYRAWRHCARARS